MSNLTIEQHIEVLNKCADSIISDDGVVQQAIRESAYVLEKEIKELKELLKASSDDYKDLIKIFSKEKDKFPKVISDLLETKICIDKLDYKAYESKLFKSKQEIKELKEENEKLRNLMIQAHCERDAEILQNKWRDVNEELPEDDDGYFEIYIRNKENGELIYGYPQVVEYSKDNGFVLICDNNGIKNKYTEVHLGKKNNFFIEGIYYGKQITHWKPITPPIEKECE